jgi:hypothetical protein
MIINPTLMIIYLSGNKVSHEIKKIEVSEIELLAGMLAISVPMLSDIKKLDQDDIDAYYLVDSNIDVSEYRIHHHIPETEISKMSRNAIKPNKFGIWIKSDMISYYDLYTFENDNFINGIITMCNTFHCDPKDYVYKFPFDNNGKYIYIEDFSSGNEISCFDAEDLNDVEDETYDDENKVEPLKKDY